MHFQSMVKHFRNIITLFVIWWISDHGSWLCHRVLELREHSAGIWLRRAISASRKVQAACMLHAAAQPG